MKDFTPYGLIIGVVIILGVGIGQHYYLRWISENMVSEIEKAETIFLTGNLENTSSQMQDTIKKWKKHEKILEVIIDHKDVNKISESLIKIDNKIKNFFYSDNISANFAVLKEYIKNVKEENLFTINNVL